MTLTSYSINRKSRGLIDMIFDLVERSRFESARDYANVDRIKMRNWFFVISLLFTLKIHITIVYLQ